MIHSIVAKYVPTAQTQGLGASDAPPVPRGHPGYEAILTTKETKWGWVEPDNSDAVRYAQEMAKANPGTTYLVFKVYKAFESPPAPVQEKTVNQTGELINVAQPGPVPAVPV